MKQKIDNSSGFTLIEVLIAALIIVFGLLSMGTFLGSLVNKNANNERRTMATSIAEQKIEDLRNQMLQNDLTGADNSLSPHQTITTPAGPFVLSWSIVEDAVGETDQVTATADWGNPTGNPRTRVTLSTLVLN